MRLRARIRARQEVVVGLFCYLMDPFIVEAACSTRRVDFIVAELEHTGFYVDRAIELARAAEVYGVVPMVRVPDARETTLIQKLLDGGFKGVLLPQIRSAEDVRRAVAATKYGPEGTRGAAHIVRGAGYSRLEEWTPERVAQLNSEIMVGVLPLENPDSIANLEEIVSVPGVDFASLGVADVTHALNHIGEWGHPEVRAVQDRLLRACAERGVATYAAPMKPGQAAPWFAKGVRMFALIDHCIFENGFDDLVGSIPEIPAQQAR